MSDRTAILHMFDGGWATDLSPRSMAAPDGNGLLKIPYLLTAENIVYELDGSIRKAPGASRVNSAAVNSGNDIHGCFDAWFHGNAGTPFQRRVLNSTTKILNDNADGTFVDLFTGLVSGAVPSYSMLEDLLIIGLDSSDVPKSWDGTTAQNLAGSPPNFGFSCSHANRTWASGVYASPSKLYYSPLLDPENSSGEGWGVINVDPSDGDRIMALASYKGELLVFKGPYKGSIHRIAGTGPTGSNGYRRQRWIEGISAAGQNTLFTFQDDLGFMSFDGSIHSLKATPAYGDFNEAALSRPIRTFLQRANFSRLKQAWAASKAGTDAGYVLFALPIDGSIVNNAVIGADLRFNPARWFYWPSYGDRAMSLMSGIDPTSNNRRIFFAGGGDGYLRKLQQVTRTIDTSTAIAMNVETPYFDYGASFNMKTAGEGFVQFAPKNDGDIGFSIRRDDADYQAFNVSQDGVDTLGGSTGFTLGTSVLATSSVIEKFFEADPVGEFRQIQFRVANETVGEDVEVHGFGLRVEGGGISTENN